MTCQVCKHFSYHCGVSLSLQKEIGKTMPNRPTNTCSFASVSWERKHAVIKKPSGINCNFELADMTCSDCGKTLKYKSDARMVISRTSFVCKKCTKIFKLEYEAKVGGVDGV